MDHDETCYLLHGWISPPPSPPGIPSIPAPSTHIYPLQVTVRNRGRNYGIVGVDDGNDVHPQQFVERAVQVAALLLVVKIEVCD